MIWLDRCLSSLTDDLAKTLQRHTACHPTTHWRKRRRAVAKASSMDPTQIRTQRIYFPVKTHKTPHSLRPVISGVSGPTVKLSGLVDRLLRPPLAMVPSLLADSRHQQEGIDIATRRYMLSTGFPRQLLWMRYIDDIFLLWPGSPQQLCDFVDFLNTGHPTVNFTLQYNMHSIDFLDINIYKGFRFQSSGILDLQPHYKLTNTSYLHFSSSHPPHVQTGLLKGELTRLLRLSSSPTTYAKHVNTLLTHLGREATLVSSL